MATFWANNCSIEMVSRPSVDVAFFMQVPAFWNKGICIFTQTIRHKVAAVDLFGELF